MGYLKMKKGNLYNLESKKKIIKILDRYLIQ